jgi:hypothetical protein
MSAAGSHLSASSITRQGPPVRALTSPGTTHASISGVVRASPGRNASVRAPSLLLLRAALTRLVSPLTNTALSHPHYSVCAGPSTSSAMNRRGRAPPSCHLLRWWRLPKSVATVTSGRPNRACHSLKRSPSPPCAEHQDEPKPSCHPSPSTLLSFWYDESHRRVPPW